MKTSGAPATIDLRLMGPVALRWRNGREVRGVLTQPKRLALLAFLAHVPSPSFHTRERLLSLLWPDLDESRGRAALNQALYYLRRKLGADALPSRGAEEIGVNSEIVVCDAVHLRRAIEQGDLQRAIDLYRGDFLEGQHLADGSAWDAWVEAERAELRALTARAASALAETAASEGRMPDAVRNARTVLSFSGTDENALRRLLDLLDRSGDRAGAIQAYEAFAGRLARDYELDVSPETRALVARIRDRAEVSDTVQRRTIGAGPGPTPGTQQAGDPAGGGHASEPMDAVASEPPTVASVPPTVPGRAKRLVGFRGLAALAALVVVVLAASWLLRDATERPAAAMSAGGAPVRLAVLPFETFNTEPEDLYLADGMTEELISRLSLIDDLRVIARTSVMPYRGSGKSVAEVGRELNVPYVLEGSVRRDGSRLRFTVQLLDARSQEHHWADDFDAESTDLLGLQRAIAERVAMALPIPIVADEQRRLARAGTSDAEAHLLYLRGRHMLAQGDPAAFTRARGYFEQALDRDPTYARAWSGLANSFAELAWAHALSPRTAHTRARAAAEKALELDPDLADAHAALARSLSDFFWEFGRAQDHFLRAIALDPSYARARRDYAAHLMVNGRAEEARAQSLAAVELDPLSYATNFQLVVEAFLGRRLEEAKRRGEALVEMWPAASASRLIVAKVLVANGQFEEALRELDRADPEGVAPPMNATRAYIYGQLGDTASVRAMLRRLDASSDDAPNDFEVAIALLALHEREPAYRRLEAAIDNRDRRARLLLREPLFEAFQDDPGFSALVRRVGLGQGV